MVILLVIVMAGRTVFAP